MKDFFVIVNSDKAKAKTAKKTIEDFFKARRDVCYEIWDGERRESYDLPDSCDCIITVGGDGTILQAARATVGTNIPLFGINCGHLGYLTQLSDETEVMLALRRLIDGDYMIEERMMLRAEGKRDGETFYKGVALNEVMLARYGSLEMLSFKVYVNDIMLNEYHADGILVATPTGSTAYSLSAGGPIADPKAKLIILTPICSHTINSRSLIFSAYDKIKIVAGDGSQMAACDGGPMCGLWKGDELEICMSEHVARFIRLKEESFLEALRQKMSYV